MNKYQLTVLIKEKVSEADRKEILDTIKKSFSNVIKEDLWGVRSLSYDIKHNSKAFFAYFEFEAEPDAVITLDKNIRLNEDIMRYLLVKLEVKKVRKTQTRPSEGSKKAEKEEKSEPELEKTEAEVEVKEAKPKEKKAKKS